MDINMKADLKGKCVFITGGSGGLGKAFAKLLVSKGANVTLFARRGELLDEAREEILAARVLQDQKVNSVTIDCSNFQSVRDAFRAQSQIPDALYCAAGGNHAENGYLVDINESQIDSCMKNNYYATIYPVKVVLDIWTEDDKKRSLDYRGKPGHRQVVMVSSAAAFLGLPGSVAYTPAKAAVRALADTLRMDFMRHSSTISTYTVHCAFPGDFLSPGFYLEQATKTDLTKRMQGIDRPLESLQASCPSSDDIASLIIAGVDKGEYVICDDSWAVSLLFTNMIGPSVKRGLGILDSLMGLLAGWVLYPILRRRWDTMAKKDGQEWRKTWSQ